VCGLRLTFLSTVLALRGEVVQAQPVVDQSTGCVLCWNGEAWKIGNKEVQSNDTAQIFDLLVDAARAGNDSIVNVLTSITGPFAFVFYDAVSSILFYGRDRFGRRSLVWQEQNNGALTISSIDITNNKPAQEVSTNGLYSIDLKEDSLTPILSEWPTASPPINRECPPSLISPPCTSAVLALQHCLLEALRLRLMKIPTHNEHLFKPNSAKVAVLFSGGLDCTLLARLAHELLPLEEPVDLLNVAFENPRSIASQKDALANPYELCPDRMTGRSSFSELAHTCPSRLWRFVAIDIPYSETVSHRPAIIQLMSPHNTEMDLSIAMALYFASRGQGSANSNSAAPQPYTTTARVLLSGLGADELFGGYSRHAAAFTRGGYQELVAELEMDFTRIGHRNLGRDDRVTSHWGREVRYPYLDEDFARFTLNLPVWQKCGFRPDKNIPKNHEQQLWIEKEDDLEPAKMALRMMMWRLKLRTVASERKRAIQFGSRTAKMDVKKGGRTKGTDVLLPG